VKLNVRFVELRLEKLSLLTQTAAVQNDANLREVTISETGVAMMAAIVGKRLTKRMKRDLAAVLQETINGQFDPEDGSEGDLFAQVYGEIFGPLFTCLERDGDFTIIRLVRSNGESNSAKRADFLLLDSNSGLVMLQEAKGHCADYEVVLRNPSSLNICQKLRAMRYKGKSQLFWPDPSMLSAKQVRVSGRSFVSISPVPHGEQSVVATVVPDGRLGSARFAIARPSHGHCANPCTSCLCSPTTNLITVLSSERLPGGQRLPPNGKPFLDWYQACERAVWGRAHGSFGNSFASLLGAWNRLDVQSHMRNQGIPLMTSIVEEALHDGVYVDFSPVFQSLQQIHPPDNLVSRLSRLQNAQRDIPRPPIREGSTGQLGRLIYRHEGDASSPQHLTGNWLITARAPDSESEGTPGEIHVVSARGNMFELTLIPRGIIGQSSEQNLRWGLSEIISGGRFPPEFIYERFTEEAVEWRHVEGRETKPYRLGRSLSDRWSPAWPWAIDRQSLTDMRACCPACDRLADLIEGWPRFPYPFPWRCFRGRRRSWFPWDNPFGPLAFITADGRAVLRIPRIGG
jgi:hypothetical protein